MTDPSTPLPPPSWLLICNETVGRKAVHISVNYRRLTEFQSAKKVVISPIKAMISLAPVQSSQNFILSFIIVAQQAYLPSRELFRSRNNASGLGIGDRGPLGRLLVRGEAGHDTIEELYPVTGEPLIDKPGKGAFANTDFDLLLRTKGIRNLIICGVTTDVCVSTTMREANDRGYDCLLVEDCCAASHKTLHNAAIETVRTEGGIFGATAKLEDVLNGLACYA
ncbi:hypothetical protein LTR56_021297 [Elasticomyces elasticus]|nr:hypothetical protein LTR56_021297 [Elasticomyces elasticus]